MFAWIKRMIAEAKARRKLAKELENQPTQHADTRGHIALDPKNDPFGLS